VADDRPIEENNAAREHLEEAEAGESLHITDAALARLEQLAESDFVSGAPHFCEELTDHAVSLGKEHEFAMASGYTKRALEFYDRMDADLRNRYRADYAWALGVHGSLLMDLGRLGSDLPILLDAAAPTVTSC
jgi:hypothetical protein